MFLLGSFTNGLFGGAQSAMSLYSGLQGIMAADAAATKSKQIEDQRVTDIANQNVPGWYPGAKQPAALPQPTSDQWKEPTPPAAPAAAPSTVPGGNTPLAVTPISAPVPQQTPQATPAGIGPVAPPDARDPYGGRSFAPPPSTAARTADQMYGNAGSLPVTPTSQLYGNAGSLPVTPPSQLYGGVPSVTAPGPAPMTSEGPPGIPPSRTPGLTAPPVYTPATASPFGTAGSPASPVPPSVTQGVGGYWGDRLGAQSPATPAGQGNAPIIPPQQTSPGVTPSAGGAPGTGGPAAPAPQAAISPAPTAGSGIGAKIGSVLSSVGQAIIPSAAAEPSGGAGAAAPADVDAVGGGGSVGAPPPAAPGSPIANATIQDAPMPGPGGTQPTQPAQPAAPAAPDQVRPGPVPVKATVPGAAGPSVQSETPPPAISPPVSPRFWHTLQQQDPELAGWVQDAVTKYGGGAVSVEQVAAHMYRESRFQRNVGLGPQGEHGVMQVWPPTQKAMEKLIGPQDASSPQGSLALGVTYLRYLARDMGLGAGPNGGSVQTNFAYMRGPGAVQFVAAHGLDAARTTNVSWKNGLGWTEDMYDGTVKLQNDMFHAGVLGANHQPVVPQTAVQVAQQGGPDGTLNYIASTGPGGLAMSELWAQYQGALERQAIWSGHLDMLPHIADFVLQQSHQGALSNLAAADAALASGNMAGAAQALAKAHAFFPDGTYARFGVSADGKNLVGEQFSESTGKSMGSPIHVTNDMIRQQMMALGNPATYAEVLQKYRLTNAQIDQLSAHAEYYRSKPDIEAAKIEGRAAVEKSREEARAALAAQAATHKQQLQDTRDQNVSALDKDIETKYDPEKKPETVSPQDWANRSEIERQIRLPGSMGGQHTGGPSAFAIAEGMVGENPKIRMRQLVDKDDPKKTVGWAIVDDEGRVRAKLGPQAGAKILQLPGISGRTPLLPPASVDTDGHPTPPANPPPNPQRQAMGIGAGAGSYAALSQGVNQNLAGVPTAPMQPPQQQAIG